MQQKDIPATQSPVTHSQGPMSQVPMSQGPMERTALRFAAVAERWFPDTFIFGVVAVAVVAIAALLNGASPSDIGKSFGDGYWSLIIFTFQMVFMVMASYVVAISPPVARAIDWLSGIPKTGRGAVAFIAATSMIVSLIGWALCLIFGAFLVRACARRKELNMDIRAACAAGYLGLGATWALGISSSAALLQANAGSLPKNILAITGVIPLTETIFLWQSMAMCAIILVLSVIIAYFSAPSAANAVTAEDLGADIARASHQAAKPERPAEWLEYSPMLTLVLVVLGILWVVREFSTQWGALGSAGAAAITFISSLNTYNFVFIILGLLLHWRPRSFLNAVSKSMPAIGGILVQYPLYGSIAMILTGAKNAAGVSVSDQLAHFFISTTTQSTFPVVVGIYSAFLGLFVPSGGGKWILEAPYVMQAANELKVHLGWMVQTYNAAEALPNLINPLFMVPMLGILGMKARDMVGFTFLQFVIRVPVVLFLLWFFAGTLTYTPPVIPPGVIP